MPKKLPRPFSQDFSGESLTDQSFAPATDVNTIVKHYENTGFDPYESRKRLAQFGDVPNVTYDEAMRLKAELDSSFALLPSHERAQHGNSVRQWLDYIEAQNAPEAPQEASQDSPADPAPQDSPEGESGV